MHTIIGTRADGSLLGEDAAGTLHRGTRRKVGYTELEYAVTDNKDGTHTLTTTYGGDLISQGTVQTIDPVERAAWVEAMQQWEKDRAQAEEDGTEVPPYPMKPLGFDPTTDKHEAKKQEENVRVIRIDADGNERETTEAREVKVLVIDWEAL